MRNSLTTALESENLNEENIDETAVADDVRIAEEEIESEFDANVRSLDTIEAMESIRDIISKMNKFTETDKALIQAAGRMAVTGTKADKNKIVPSMENLKDVKVATEYIGESIVDAISSVLTHTGHLIKKIVDYYQYFYTLINLEQGKIDRLRKKVNAIKSQTKKGKFIEIRISGSKYFRHGEDRAMCKDAGEFLNKYEEACDFNSKFLEYTSEFTTGDFMSSYKTLFSPLTGYDKNYNKMFTSFKTYVDKSKKIKSMTKIKTNSVKIEYKSPMLLGLSYLHLTEPNPSNYNMHDVDSMKEVASYYSSRFVRDTKFSMSITDGSAILFNVDIGYVEHLLDQAQEVVDAIEDFANYINKLSTWGTTWTLPSFIGNLVGNPLVFLLASYRLMLKCSFTIFNTTSSIYNFSKGVTGTALSVCDKLVSSPKWYRD